MSPSAGPPSWAVRFGGEFWRKPHPGITALGSPAVAAGISPVQVNDALERVTHAFVEDPSGSHLQAQGNGYRAALGKEGLSFEPAAPAGTGPSCEARIHVLSVNRGERSCLAETSGASSWFVVGNTAQALLEAGIGLVEHFEAGSGGVEVSWVLNRPVPGEGDLVVKAELAGAHFSRASSSGLHFADDSGVERIKVGRAVAMDSQGQAWPVSLEAKGPALCAVVPGEVLDNAQFPLAIDPLVSAEFGMDQPLDGPSPCTRAAPAVAATSSGYLVAWTHGKGQGTAPAIYAARLSPAGKLLDPDGILVSGLAAEQAVCAVAGNPEGFVIVWSAPRDSSTTDWEILGARVQPDGTVLDNPPLTVSGQSGNVKCSPAIAANGDNCLAVWRDSRSTGIYGAIVTPDGGISPTNGVPICTAPNDQYLPAVAALGTNYLVAWQDYRKASSSQYYSSIYAARVAGNGVVIDTNGLAVCTGVGSQYHPAVAANSTNFIVVWEGYDAGGNDILGARVSLDGVVLDTNALILCHAPSLQANPVATAIGADSLIVWQDCRGSPTNNLQATIYGARVHGDGSVADPGGVALSASAGEQWYPAVAAWGDNALAVWQDSRNNPATTLADIYGAQASAATNFLVQAETRLSHAVNAEFSPALAANGASFLVVWVDNRNAMTTGLDLYGVRLTQTGSVLDALPIPICTAPGNQAQPAVAANGAEYLVAWADWRNSPTNTLHSDIYGTLISSDGVVQAPQGIPICTATNDQNLPAVTALGTNFMVVWQDMRRSSMTITQIDIMGTRVSANGDVLDPTGIPVCLVSGSHTASAIAANGTQALAVWTDAHYNSTSTHIYGARLSADGTLLDTNDLAICTAPTLQASAAVASSGEGYLVVWADSRNGSAYAPDIYGTFVDNDGLVSPTNGFPIRLAPGPQTAPAVAFDGSEYVVAWQEPRGGSTSSYYIAGTRVGLDGTVPPGLLLSVDASPYDNLTPVAATAANGQFLVLNQDLQSAAYRTVGNFVNIQALPRLDGCALLPNGQCQFVLHGAVGESYAIQASDDLSAWVSIATLTLANNSAPFIDAASPPASRRFYRASLLP